MTVYVDMSPGKGRGVFAAKNFLQDEIIEICPVYIIPEKDYASLEAMEFTDYVFAWGENDEGYCICFGYGSIYNHSHEPNIEFEPDLKNATIVFKALRDIEKGEELLSDYNWDDDADLAGWFKDYMKQHKEHYEKKKSDPA